jgi:hypothetical protein
MSEYAKLKELAEAAIDQNERWKVAGEPWPIWNRCLLEMQFAANPAVVLGLIAENERLLKLLTRVVDQHVPLTELEGVPGWSRVVELVEVTAQRDALKAECGGLRVDAGRWKWLEGSADPATWEQIGYQTHMNRHLHVDAAMGKGERS